MEERVVWWRLEVVCVGYWVSEEWEVGEDKCGHDFIIELR